MKRELRPVTFLHDNIYTMKVAFIRVILLEANDVVIVAQLLREWVENVWFLDDVWLKMITDSGL
jgi:hypothetical protein